MMIGKSMMVLAMDWVTQPFINEPAHHFGLPHPLFQCFGSP